MKAVEGGGPVFWESLHSSRHVSTVFCQWARRASLGLRLEGRALQRQGTGVVVKSTHGALSSRMAFAWRTVSSFIHLTPCDCCATKSMPCCQGRPIPPHGRESDVERHVMMSEYVLCCTRGLREHDREGVTGVAQPSRPTRQATQVRKNDAMHAASTFCSFINKSRYNGSRSAPRLRSHGCRKAGPSPGRHPRCGCVWRGEHVVSVQTVSCLRAGAGLAQGSRGRVVNELIGKGWQARSAPTACSCSVPDLQQIWVEPGCGFPQRRSLSPVANQAGRESNVAQVLNYCTSGRAEADARSHCCGWLRLHQVLKPPPPCAHRCPT
eukprot:364943-Chlamydomonas_euryale.AAC.18